IAVVADFGRRVAGQDSRRSATSGESRARHDWRRVAHCVASLSAERCSMAASLIHTWTGRMPCRRHGPWQDDAGTRADAGAATHGLVTRSKPSCRSSVAAGELDFGDRKIFTEPEDDRGSPFDDIDN